MEELRAQKAAGELKGNLLNAKCFEMKKCYSSHFRANRVKMGLLFVLGMFVFSNEQYCSGNAD